MMNKRNATLLSMILLAYALPGCSLLSPPGPPPAIYVLHPKLNDATKGQYSGVLQLSPPALPAGFDTDKVALYWDNGRRLDYYAGAKWPAPLQDMLQDFIMRSARHAFPGMTMAGPDMDVPAQYRLAVKVLDFQPVYQGKAAGAPTLYAALQFTLIRLPDEKPVADFVVSGERQAQSDDMTAIAAGLEALLQELLPQAFAQLPLQQTARE